SLVGQWKRIQAGLPDDWVVAELRLEVRSERAAERAAALLGPVQPFRPEPTVLRFSSARGGTGLSPDLITRLLRRLDQTRIMGELKLDGSQVAPTRAVSAASSLAESWGAALAGLPADWSDLYAELRLLSTDYLERAAVLCAPLNPRR